VSLNDPFANHPPKRLFLERERAAFRGALETVRRDLGREYPLQLAGREVRTADVAAVLNPSHPTGPPLGYVHLAGDPEVDRALALVTEGSRAWSDTPISVRAQVLEDAADRLAERQDTVAAWEVHEAAKSWTEALADVGEAIDYLRFYAREALALAPAWSDFRARGVVAVIPPWNFPAAIPCGMAAAALAAGNTVVLKPAERTPLVAWHLVRVLHEAGVPETALVWMPGRGEVAGARLVASPDVDMIAFTGSAAVGTSIYRAGSTVRLRRNGMRATVAEMGGKNPILVFADADLDEAVAGILTSAFGHSGQKCSAASRVLIHRSIYTRLRERLVEGARSLARGPAEEAGSFLTPLIDAEARQRVETAIEKAAAQGNLLLAPAPPSGSSVESTPAIVEIPAEQSQTSTTTQEEIFGPVLALTCFDRVDEGLALANASRYALTAGVYSRSPATIERTAAQLEAGNIYINRPTTGARVGVEPFGGHRMSGTGPKAGSREYLWAFVTGKGGYRGGRASSDVSQNAPTLVESWPSAAAARSSTVWRAIKLLAGPWRAQWQEAWSALGREPINGKGLDLISQLVERSDEVARPEPTATLRGQQTSMRWDRARGCGAVVTEAATAPEHVLALIVAPILAGNGIAVSTGSQHATLAGVVVRALLTCGVPDQSLRLMSGEFGLQRTLELPRVTFAAVDACRARTQQIYEILARASATPESPNLKALITLTDGPRPDQPGFLRRFALPRTVAVRTLHLGAELELA